MLVELDMEVTYQVRGTFDIPDNIAKQIEIGEQECPSDFTEWCADHISEADCNGDWTYDIWNFELIED